MANPTPDPHRDDSTPQPEEGLRPEADPRVVRPEQEEPNGPVPGLLATAAASASAEVGLASEADEEQLEATGVEEEGIASAQIVGITAAILISVFLMGFVVFWAFYLPELGESEDVASARVELGTDQRTILAEGQEVLNNYSMTADSTYTLPIDLAMMAVVEDNAGAPADDALGGSIARDDVPVAVTRQGFNVGPVNVNSPRAVRAASSRGAFTAPVPETADEAPVPPTVAAEPLTDEQVGIDELPDTDTDE